MFASFHPALRDLVRFDRSKIRGLTAFQNATGVFVPLAVGAATGHLLLGLAASIGALNACFSDRPGPYGLRAGRMVVVSFLGALSALVGGTTGSIQWLAVALVALWGLGGGMLVVSGPGAEQIGVTSIILLVVYGGFGLSPSGALLQAAFILVGGLFQAVLSVVAWPFRPFGPERNALAAVFRQLAAFARAPSEPTEAPPVTAEITTARTTLTGLGAVHTTAAEALRVLLDEAERIRLEFIALHHLRSVLPDDDRQPLHSANFEGVWTAASELLDRLAAAVTCGETVLEGAQILQRAQRYVTAMRQVIEGGVRDDAVVGEALSHVDALLGQLRACVEIVDSGRAVGMEQSSDAVPLTIPWLTSGVSASLSILQANLTLRSASFRHALRLAVTLAIAAALARYLGLARSYWVPLTVAIVLKPDFTSTFTRGVLRMVGTMAGLGLATLLVHLVSGNIVGQIALIGVLTFSIRSVGPANFGVSAVTVTALVVILTSLAGASPESTIHFRGIDTLIGGLLSLVAYALWPTWERGRTPAVLADMLDAYRRYFDLVMTGYLQPGQVDRARLDRVRLEARLARSNAEASVERMRSEPAGSDQDLDLARGILASSHRFAHSAMTLEASLYTATELAVPQGLDRFVRDVDTRLEALNDALQPPARAVGPLAPARRSTGQVPAPVDLRADQNALIESVKASSPASSPLLLETERITNSLNTIMDLACRWGGDSASPRSERSPEQGVTFST